MGFRQDPSPEATIRGPGPISREERFQRCRSSLPSPASGPRTPPAWRSVRSIASIPPRTTTDSPTPRCSTSTPRSASIAARANPPVRSRPSTNRTPFGEPAEVHSDQRGLLQEQVDRVGNCPAAPPRRSRRGAQAPRSSLTGDVIRQMSETYVRSDGSRRVVITGIGAVSPNGIGREHFWHATRAGTSGVGRISAFDPEDQPTRIAGEVGDFQPTAWIDPKDMRHVPGRSGSPWPPATRRSGTQASILTS